MDYPLHPEITRAGERGDPQNYFCQPRITSIPFENTACVSGNMGNNECYCSACTRTDNQEYGGSRCNQYYEDYGAISPSAVNNANVNMFDKKNSVFDGPLPCHSFDNWDYASCYSFYANGCYNTCQFVNMMDIEDFM